MENLDHLPLLKAHSLVVSIYLQYSEAVANFETERRNFLRRGFTEADLFDLLRGVSLPGVSNARVPPETLLDHNDFTSRTANVVIMGEGIKTIGELASFSEFQLMRFPNFGRRCLAEIRDYLSERGYQLHKD